MATATKLPAELVRYLDGTEQAAEESAIVICSVDNHGFPHPALLSRGEVVAVDAQSLRLAIQALSRTAAHLRRDGRLTMIVVHEGTAYYVKAAARELSPAMRIDAAMAKWQADIVDIRADRPDPRFERGARLITGITFVNPVERQTWARGTLAELRE